MSTKNIIVLILFIISLVFYYRITEPTSKLITAKVIKVIDGDTIQIEDKTKIRLLGINTPEKHQPYYQEAKDFLTNLVQNKTIQIESYGEDKYKRTLAYIFQKDKNINNLILQNGLATLYYYKEDSYYQTLKETEKFARNNNLALWKKSPNSHCIQITKFKTDEPELLILQNSCNFTINLTYKDDASHIYSAILKQNSEYINTFSHIWNTKGDSIYIYNDKGLLRFYRYA